MNYQLNRKIPDWPSVQKSTNHRSKKGQAPLQTSTEHHHKSAPNTVTSPSSTTRNQHRTPSQVRFHQLQDSLRILLTTTINQSRTPAHPPLQAYPDFYQAPPKRQAFYSRIGPKEFQKQSRLSEARPKDFSKNHYKASTEPRHKSIKHHHDKPSPDTPAYLKRIQK